jgi:hypothetical protein
MDQEQEPRGARRSRSLVDWVLAYAKAIRHGLDRSGETADRAEELLARVRRGRKPATASR